MPGVTNHEPAVLARGLRKSFRVGKREVEAVRGVDLTVRRGEVFGFLGPNGAGKTTTLRMLTTLLPIGGGSASVAGFDVAGRPGEVRRRIGYVGQKGGADVLATGRENLVLQGRLHRMGAREATRRAAELVQLLALEEFADRQAMSYSGGQRRRLEVALGIMHRPEVLFLDEPTTGLDPQNRANLWDQVRALQATGTTVFLTTHYLEEADALADRLAIIDHGRIVAEGTPLELKRDLSAATVLIRAELEPPALAALRDALASQGGVRSARIDGPAIHLDVEDPTTALAPIAAILHARSVPLHTLSLSEPSLDDVFLRRTGRSLRDASDGGMDAAATQADGTVPGTAIEGAAR